MADAALQMARSNFVNYTSVLENEEDTKVEVERLEQLGFLKRITKQVVERKSRQEQETSFNH